MVQSVWAATAARTLPWTTKRFGFRHVQPCGIGDHSGATFHQLRVGQLHVHHAVALHVTESNHRSGREPVEEKFGGRSAFMRVDPVTNSGPVTTATTG